MIKDSTILTKEQTNTLLKLPESGMGYQIVNLLLKSGEIVKNCLVKNAKELVAPAGRADIPASAIKSIELAK